MSSNTSQNTKFAKISESSLTPSGSSISESKPSPSLPMQSLILLARLFILAITLLALFSLMRLVMVEAYLPSELLSSNPSDLMAMWHMGAKLDMRSISIALLIFLAFAYIFALCAAFVRLYQMITKRYWGGGKAEKFQNLAAPYTSHTHALSYLNTLFTTLAKFLSYLGKFYAFLLGFVFALFAIVNFYYFRTYGGKIDIFIFGFKDDDTLAILEIMWRDYPVFVGLLLCVGFGALILWLYNITPHLIMRLSRVAKPSLPSYALHILTHLCVIALLIIGTRGSVGKFPIREDLHYISTIPIFNHLATNPIIAFSWAWNNYKHDMKFTPPALDRIQALEEQLFPIMGHTNHSDFLQSNPPHVLLSFMESFGSNLLIYDDEQTNDLLGDLRGHFEQDFVFYRFLSGANGTAPSFAALFFNSPTANISLGVAKSTTLPHNPFKIYADSGYEVIYITSGYASWQGLGAFITKQGANKVYDAISLFELFPESQKDKNTYGVPDEYAYRLAFELLSKASKPTFIAILTTSNHPPHHLSSTYTPKVINPTDELMAKAQGASLERVKLSNILYQYANDAFGKFITQIKASPLATRTILAATGDHRLRDFSIDPVSEKALSYATPLYLYVPPRYQRDIVYDPLRFGSHKDIFPTLYALSLSNIEYLSLGGRNILAHNDNASLNFGYNVQAWIDKEGIYPLSSQKVGYKWQSEIQETHISESSPSNHAFKSNLPIADKVRLYLISSNQSFTPSIDKAHLMTLYAELLNMSISQRVLGTQPHK